LVVRKKFLLCSSVVIQMSGCVAPKQQPQPGADDDGSTDAGDDDDDDDSETTATSSSTTIGDESSSDDGEDSHFIQEPDGGPGTMECDIWAQDCDAGQKCAPWVNDGGNAWNATKCVPLVENPAQVGDECMAEGGGGSGLDNCDKAAMCWHVDETGMGTCIAFCQGSPAAPVCEDTNTACSISNDVLALCLPVCDPLTQSCDLDGGEACYLNGNTESFFCAPDYSGETGAYGDPCDSMYINVCDPYLLCVPSNAVPNCDGTSGCCTPFCPVSEGAANCPGAAGGQECVAVYAENNAPPGYEDVGICMIPM
jgi:hypothetical protein